MLSFSRNPHSARSRSRAPALARSRAQIFYYWVAFGPLSRGSAACGYVVMLGLLLALGVSVADTPMPEGVQMDWEAILRPSPRAFIDEAAPWLYRARRRCAHIGARDDPLRGVPLVAETFATTRDVLRALNAD